MIKLLSIFNLITLLIYPADAPHVTVNTQVGDVTIYFNESIDNKLIYDKSSSLLINISSSTISGYAEINGTSYTIYFPVYDTPYYRYYSSGSSYNYTTVEFEYMDDPEISNFSLYVPQSSNLPTYLLVGILGFIFLIFIRSK